MDIRKLPQPDSRWLHKKTGGVYRVLNNAAKFQGSGEHDGTRCIAYQEWDNRLSTVYFRPATEFMDGRFTKLD